MRVYSTSQSWWCGCMKACPLNFSRRSKQVLVNEKHFSLFSGTKLLFSHFFWVSLPHELCNCCLVLFYYHDNNWILSGKKCVIIFLSIKKQSSNRLGASVIGQIHVSLYKDCQCPPENDIIVAWIETNIENSETLFLPSKWLRFIYFAT